MKEARNGLNFWRVVAKVGYASKIIFVYIPLWMKPITAVGNVEKIWELGTYEI